MNQLLKTNRQTKLTPRMKIHNIFVNSRIYELSKQLKKSPIHLSKLPPSLCDFSCIYHYSWTTCNDFQII